MRVDTNSAKLFHDRNCYKFEELLQFVTFLIIHLCLTSEPSELEPHRVTAPLK
jgi:hypothetical protein